MLVGREAELRELLGAAATARRVGRGFTALLSGDAGIGKTRLAAEVADRLRDDGMTVAWAAAGRTAAHPVLAVVQLSGGPGSGDVLPLGRPRRARSGPVPPLRGRRRRVAGVRSGLLVLDDLHWADAPSLRLLDAVGATLDTAPVLLLGTYRDTEPGATGLAELRRRPPVRPARAAAGRPWPRA